MRVFKFGGASVKDAKSFINLKNILLNQKEGLIVIVSAMGKTTNKLEKIWENYIKKDFDKATLTLNEIISYHQDICIDLKLDKNQKFINKFNSLCDELSNFISKKKTLKPIVVMIK